MNNNRTNRSTNANRSTDGANRAAPATATYPLTLYFDDACRMCGAEMQALRERDVLAQLRFVDVSPADYVAPPHTTRAAMMTAIHAQTADGRWVVGVEALRLAYEGIGLGWLAAPTTWPFMRQPADRAYAWIARHRYAMPRWFAPAFAALLPPYGRRTRERLHAEADRAAVRARCGDTGCRIDERR